jgi:hypothetical protein
MKCPPYAERPEIIAKWCTCERDENGDLLTVSIVEHDYLGNEVEPAAIVVVFSPDCRLHNPDPRHDLPEGI